MKWLNIVILVLNILLLGNAVKAQELYQVSSININTREFVEECAVPYGNGIVFISNRSQSALIRVTDEEGQPLNDIFFSRIKDNKKFSSPDLFSKDFRTRMHEGAICFDSTGKVAYFTRVVDQENSALYTATFNGTNWVDINPMAFNMNRYSFGHPCLSPDGKRLFFSSNRPGGHGGRDIWVATHGRGGWGQVKNLGPVVNSDSSEYYPFLSKNGKLYFASNRKGSQGGFDIYWTMELNGRWLPPKPLPPPFNSKYDDYAYVSDSYDRSGYLSSTRSKSPDIFSFINNFPKIDNPKPILRNTYRYRFRETAITDSATFLYEWDFGDGTKIRGKELDVIHTFPKVGDYMVSLNIIDSLTGEVQLNQAANIIQVRDEIQPVISCNDTIFANEEYVFDSKNSYLPDFPSPKFYWDLGDGTQLIGPIIKHSYYYPGIYRIVLFSEDKRKGQNDTEVLSVFKTIVVIERKN